MFAVERRGPEVSHGVSLTHNMQASVEMKLPMAEKVPIMDAVVEPWPASAQGFTCGRGPNTAVKPFTAHTHTHTSGLSRFAPALEVWAVG